MIRSINLLSHLPQYVQEYREIQEIMRAEIPEIQAIFDESETIKNNQFAMSCNEDGIARFEELFGLLPNDYDELSARILRVLSYCVDGLPYTLRYLCMKLDAIFGVGEYELLTDFSNYQMEINVNTMLSSQIEVLEDIIWSMVPANIVTEIYNTAKRVVEKNVRFGSVVTILRKKEFFCV
ncbi:MAG: putative phage tail protein [Bacillota bacterium]